MHFFDLSNFIIDNGDNVATIQHHNNNSVSSSNQLLVNNNNSVSSSNQLLINNNNNNNNLVSSSNQLLVNNTIQPNNNGIIQLLTNNVPIQHVIKCICARGDQVFHIPEYDLHKYVKCKTCKKYLHLDCLRIKMNENNRYDPYECHMCRSSTFDSFEEVKVTHSEVPLRNNRRIRIDLVIDQVTTDKLHDVNDPRNIRLVCLSAVNSTKIHAWPWGVMVKVNGIVIKVGHRSVTPFTVTNHKPELISILLRQGINTIEIENAFDNNAPFILLIQTVFVQNIVTYVNKIKMESFVSYEDGLKNVAKSFKSSNDDEIIATSINLNLRCPISMSRINNPGKGKNCTHIQCFDLETYVNMYRNNSSLYAWRCPVCNNKIIMDDLIYDNYFASILEKTGGSNSIVEIVCDGSWKLLNNDNNNEYDDDDEFETKKIVNVIVLDDDDDK
jgi:hypothetical protein